MLFKALKAQVQKYGLTDEIVARIDLFYATGKITEEQYKELMGIE